MPDLHKVAGFVVVAVFAVGWIWGLGSWIAKRGPGAGYWIWLTVAQVVIGTQAVLGVIVYLQGYRADTLLHYAYGIFPFIVLAIAHVTAREARHMKPSPRTGRI